MTRDDPATRSLLSASIALAITYVACLLGSELYVALGAWAALHFAEEVNDIDEAHR